MLTYDLSTADGPLYVSLAKCIRDDITAGRLHRSEHLPSKRSLARNLGISTITVQNAYDQLVSEGYVSAIEKKGYYVTKEGGKKKEERGEKREKREGRWKREKEGDGNGLLVKK